MIAVIVSYAVLLQAFLGAATACPSPDLIDVICSSHGPVAPSNDAPAQHDHGCCTAVHINKTMPLPPVAYDTAPVARPVQIVVFSVEKLAPKTGPPTASHGARSPPVA